jgi:hypothetical protein
MVAVDAVEHLHTHAEEARRLPLSPDCVSQVAAGEMLGILSRQGHAAHLGAMGGSFVRLSPSWLDPLCGRPWGSVALTRVMLLAHYPSDVEAGWASAC